MIVEIFGSELKIDESLIEETEEEIRSQIKEYLDGGRKSFDLEFSFPEGSQGSILRKMDEIPYGETQSYGELAEKAGSSAVAVGQTCSDNPLPILIPCHRVVGRNALGGYQAGREVKRKLLELEGADF